MPELPEVETIKRDLQKKICGQKIVKITVYDSRVVTESAPGEFARAQGKEILSVARRGKGLILELSGGYFLCVHLRMTGQLIYGEDSKKSGLKETKIVFHLSSGKFLNYNDQRLFGKLAVVKDLAQVSFLNKLGPEPLEKTFTTGWLRTELKRRSTPIKVLLLNQEFLAGIGNIYASEILFQARINPKKAAHRLSLNEIKLLQEATGNILQAAIDGRGTSMRNYRDSAGEKGKFKSRIKVYGRESEPCVQCQFSIKRIVQAARSTYFCPRCQR